MHGPCTSNWSSNSYTGVQLLHSRSNDVELHILKYLWTFSQKENVLASFWVQRVLVTQQRPSRVMVTLRPSRVMVKCDIWSPPFFPHTKCFNAPYRALSADNEQITYIVQFLDVGNMFSVKSPDRTLQIIHLSQLVQPRMACYETDWCDVIGSVFLAVPPTVSGWRLMQKPREKST
jgi:hypothetical protein